MSEKALARHQALVEVLDRVALNDARISEAAAKAFKVSRSDLAQWEQMDPVARQLQLDARGWTEEDFQVALESRKPRSEATYGVQMAHERTMARIRQAVERGAPTVNVAVVIPAAVAVSDDELEGAPIIDVGES